MLKFSREVKFTARKSIENQEQVMNTIGQNLALFCAKNPRNPY